MIIIIVINFITIEALISGLVTCISPSVEAMHSQVFFIVRFFSFIFFCYFLVQTESILESIIAKPASVIALGKQFLFKQLEMDNLADAYRYGCMIRLSIDRSVQ